MIWKQDLEFLTQKQISDQYPWIRITTIQITNAQTEDCKKHKCQKSWPRSTDLSSSKWHALVREEFCDVLIGTEERKLLIKTLVK